MRIYRNCTRTVHLGSAVALHCVARTAGAFSSMIMLTVSRPVAIRFSHGTHRGCRHIAKDFLWVSFPNGKQFALYLKWSSFVPISRCLWTLRTGLPFAEAGYARFFTGRSLMVANDGHHTRRRTFHAVSFGAFA